MAQEIKKTKVNVIQKDAFDQLAWSSVSEAKKVLELYKDASEEGVTQDVFSSLYKTEPKLTEEGPASQKGVLEQMMQLPEFEHLRASTQIDDISSAIATMELGPQVLQQYREILKKIEENKAKKPAPKDGSPKDQTEGEGETLADQIGEDGMAQLRQSLRRGIQSAQEKTDQNDQMGQSWGLNSEEFKQAPFEKRLEIAQYLAKSSKLRNISDLVGRFKNVVKAAQATVPSHGYDEIVDVGLGNDIPRLVPSEFFKFSKQRTLFYKDFLEKKLLNYSLRGVENLGKGPIIVCQDKSGSMDDGRDEWATAVTLALMDVAVKESRAFGIIPFDTICQQSMLVKKGVKPNIESKIGYAMLGTGGGTNFYRPLFEALTWLKNEEGFKPADIVFITDGEYEFDETDLNTILELKKATGARIYGILIKDGTYANADGLTQFCDQISMVDNLGEIDTMKNLVNKVYMPASK